MKQARSNDWLLDVEPEIWHLYVIFLWWILSDIYIIIFTNDAIYIHNFNTLCRDNNILDIFINESIIDDHIKASAVIFEFRQKKLCYINIKKITMIFEAELQNLTMTTTLTLKIKKIQNWEIWTVNIYVDNQVVIWVFINLKQQSEQYLLWDMIQNINKLQKQKICVQIHWISVYVEILNNEKVNKTAKMTAQEFKVYLRKIYYLMITCKQSLWKQVVKQWTNE